MSVDGYQTDDIAFCAALLYVFTEDALTTIDLQNGKAMFSLAVASLDARIYREEFDRGELNILDLKSYMRTFSWLSKIIREMRRDGQIIWQRDNKPTPPRPESFWINARAAMAQRQAERDAREKQERRHKRN
jgi:hypothetical protein